VGCLFCWHCYLHLTFLVCYNDLERVFECLVWCLIGWFLCRAVQTSFQCHSSQTRFWSASHAVVRAIDSDSCLSDRGTVRISKRLMLRRFGWLLLTFEVLVYCQYFVLCLPLLHVIICDARDKFVALFLKDKVCTLVCPNHGMELRPS
jgi:hypothetical protein